MLFDTVFSHVQKLGIPIVLGSTGTAPCKYLTGRKSLKHLKKCRMECKFNNQYSFFPLAMLLWMEHEFLVSAEPEIQKQKFSRNSALPLNLSIPTLAYTCLFYTWPKLCIYLIVIICHLHSFLTDPATCITIL